MRVDHYAYSRATKVAGIGLLLQLVMGTVLLVFGIIAPQEAAVAARGDTAFAYAALYVLAGCLVWLSLIIILYQHKLERLEAIEEDELAGTRGATTSIFERGADEQRVAARRLILMHKWLMPLVSLLLAGVLSALALWVFLSVRVAVLAGDTPFHLTSELGWAVAICLTFAAISFIFSRFVAGMAKQPVWQNLRGGAAYMGGNALLILAVAVGIGFRFFGNNAVIENIILYAIPALLLIVSAEIVFNFILNMYRPRIPGEVPRPAFDSRILSQVAAPDSIVRTINEAVNYQFGFDVAGSWGYQLLLRSSMWLVAFGIAVLVGLNTMVIVEPHQQAVRLRGGEIVGDVHGSGIMWKRPWPLETAAVHNVDRIRELPLTARRVPRARTGLRGVEVNLWSDKVNTDVELDPFIVRGSRLRAEIEGAGGLHGAAAEAEAHDPLPSAGGLYALVDVEIILDYRIKPGGLLEYLNFAPDTVLRRQGGLTMRQLALKVLALRSVSNYLSHRSLDEVLAQKRPSLAMALKGRIQAAFDEHTTGVEVVAVKLPMVRPASGAAESFEDLAISREARQKSIAEAERIYLATMTALLGDPALADVVLAAIEDFNAMRARHDRLSAELGEDAPAVRELSDEIERKRLEIETALFRGGGLAGQMIGEAEQERWITFMMARADASWVEGQLPAYHAAPALYRERERMQVLIDGLKRIRQKFIIGIDPSRISLDVDLKGVMPLLQSGVALEEGTKQ